jgi:hypothetical protein
VLHKLQLFDGFLCLITDIFYNSFSGTEVKIDELPGTFLDERIFEVSPAVEHLAPLVVDGRRRVVLRRDQLVGQRLQLGYNHCHFFF